MAVRLFLFVEGSPWDHVASLVGAAYWIKTEPASDSCTPFYDLPHESLLGHLFGFYFLECQSLEILGRRGKNGFETHVL